MAGRRVTPEALDPERAPGRDTGNWRELGLRRTKPRSFAEWQALRRWNRLPEWEVSPAGYLLREARLDADLTQAALADKLGVTQQAVAQAERWDSNPTVSLLRAWAEALGRELFLRVDSRPQPGPP